MFNTEVKSILAEGIPACWNLMTSTGTAVSVFALAAPRVPKTTTSTISVVDDSMATKTKLLLPNFMVSSL